MRAEEMNDNGCVDVVSGTLYIGSVIEMLAI